MTTFVKCNNATTKVTEDGHLIVELRGVMGASLFPPLQAPKAAQWLDVSQATLMKWVREHGCPHTCILGKYLFTKESLTEWVEANTKRIPVRPKDTDEIPAVREDGSTTTL